MTQHTDRPAVRMERTIAAPRSRVYRAWLEPDLLRRWLAPGDMEVSRVDVDERRGGHVRIWQRSAGQEVGGFDCELVEMVTDELLVFRWGSVGPDRTNGPTFDSVLTITLLDAADGATTLGLVHERLDALADAMPQIAGQVGRGCVVGLTLDKLDATVHDDASTRA